VANKSSRETAENGNGANIGFDKLFSRTKSSTKSLVVPTRGQEDARVSTTEGAPRQTRGAYHGEE
jgi:hypothetical protein